MSICDVKICGSDLNIWKVSNDNESVPFYQDFHLCDICLHLKESVKKIHKALVLGRFDRQDDNDVSNNSWNLEKVVATWKKGENPYMKCSTCSKTEKIWIVVKETSYETNRFCDNHLYRWDYPKDPKVRSWNDNVGISTIENTWIKEQKGSVEPLSKKNKV